MPRFAVLADIHGNLIALEAVLGHARAQGVDGLLVAGDLVGGPQCNEVVERLQDWAGRTVVRGNSEEYMIAYDRGRVSPEQRHSDMWAFSRTCFQRCSSETLALISGLPPQLVVADDGRAPIRIVHGSTSSSTEPLRPDRNPKRVAEVLEAISEAVLICGHTHVTWISRHAGRLAFNPGSVGVPCNGDTRAQYALLAWEDDGWHVEHQALAYDLDRVKEVYLSSGFLEAAGPMARAQLEAIYRAVPTMGSLARHARRLASREGIEPGGVVPSDIWNRAAGTFDWQLPPP